VATVGMVADIVRNIGGPQMDVRALMGPGVDPHLYKATRDDVRAILDADVVFYVGLMLEGKMNDTLEKLSKERPVLAVTRGIERQKLLMSEGESGHVDPHVWMDVLLWSECVDAVVQGLSQADPSRVDAFQAQADQYRDRLLRLHDYGKRVMATVPEERRWLITSHDAFRYLGRAYGVQVQGVQGISTESEAGLQHINALVDLLVEKQIRSVFVESSVSTKSLMAIIEGARARGHDVQVGGELFSDAMGQRDTYEGTFEGMLDHNLTLIARGLGGSAPDQGLNARLSEQGRGAKP
jgi:manganese/zinc/iron transport system substrate-binding protein